MILCTVGCVAVGTGVQLLLKNSRSIAGTFFSREQRIVHFSDSQHKHEEWAVDPRCFSLTADQASPRDVFL